MADGDIIACLNAARYQLRDSYWWRRTLNPNSPWDDATALAHIHLDELPASTTGPDHSLAELVALRPFALMWADISNGFSWTSGSGDFCCANIAGQIILQLELPIPTNIANDPQAVAVWVNTALGRIIRTDDEAQPGILDLSAKIGPDGPYLPITAAKLTGYIRSEVKDRYDLGDFIRAELELTWGVTT